jgi:hypothetical protein
LADCTSPNRRRACRRIESVALRLARPLRSLRAPFASPCAGLP